MSEKLLVIEDAFLLNGRGLVISPKITVQNARRDEFRVRLKLPSGEEREAKARIDVAHIAGKFGAFGMYRLFDVTSEDVPAGTEIWSVDE